MKLAFSLVWLSLACMQTMTPQGSIVIRTIDKGAQSNIDRARQVVVRAPAEWGALWTAHNGDRPAPAVDFSRDMVVAVFMGSCPTGGFSVEIVSVAERDGGLSVSYRETAPGPGAVAAQVLTAPYHIVAVPKHAGDVRFAKAT